MCFDQINSALVSKTDFFQKHLKLRNYSRFLLPVYGMDYFRVNYDNADCPGIHTGSMLMWILTTGWIRGLCSACALWQLWQPVHCSSALLTITSPASGCFWMPVPTPNTTTMAPWAGKHWPGAGPAVCWMQFWYSDVNQPSLAYCWTTALTRI